MSKRILIAGVVLLAAALVMLAADAVTGKWVMERAGRGGGPTRVTTFDLKADGAKLTGTITEPGFGPPGETPPPPTTTPIADGKVDGNNVSFNVNRDFGGNTMTFKYEGAVSGSEMKVKMTFQGMGGDPMVIEGTAKKQ
jgi:hypothetical protein